MFLHQDNYIVKYHSWDVVSCPCDANEKVWGPIFTLMSVTSTAVAVGRGEEGMASREDLSALQHTPKCGAQPISPYGVPNTCVFSLL